jgi:hypothetical protein
MLGQVDASPDSEDKAQAHKSVTAVSSYLKQ